MQFPSWLTWYKKPAYRDIKEYSADVRFGRRQLSPDGRGKTSIPGSLKLERILENKTCEVSSSATPPKSDSNHVAGSPMSLYDFYLYLKYIEFSAENLEFYVWYKRYETSWLKAGSDGDSSSLHSIPASTSSEAPLGEKQGGIDVYGHSVDAEVGKSRRSSVLCSTVLTSNLAPRQRRR
jgi:hypothetical protein